MKLKELHIRNIASIEKGDINFENGLRDAISGEIAPLFLISGDTGAGKTVILDCIAMALYKKTPRIDGVANANQNDYVNTEGETLRVASLEQYTRLGISASDECYSEVIFEGNDGVDYHARLSLGMQRGRKGLKHRKPVWEVKRGNDDWLSGNAEVANLIQQAVGLTFDQFGRMAMLAQGQFATFLTGNKAEREAILEQLTNTERFSKYGIAIKNLFDRAKAICAQIQTEYNTEKLHILEEEERKMLCTKQAQFDAEKKALEVRISRNEERLSLATTITKCRADQFSTRQSLEQLQEVVNSKAYKADIALVEGWDTTTTQRQTYLRMKDAQTQREKALAKLPGCHDLFDRLSSDLVQRNLDLRKQADLVSELRLWLSERKPWEILYARSGELVQKIRQYEDCLIEMQSLSDQIQAETAKSSVLKDQLKVAKKASEQAMEAVFSKQQAIDALIKQREVLAPATINRRLDEANKRNVSLRQLQQTMQSILTESADIDKLKETVQEENLRLHVLQKEAQRTEKAYLSAKEKAEAANNLLHTMRTSIEDYLVTLRQRLVAEHADTCPLCGQSIDHHLLDRDFNAVLTPLEREKAAVDKALIQAMKANEEAKKQFNTAYGILHSQKKSYDERVAKLTSVQVKMQAVAGDLGLDVAHSLGSQLSSALMEAELWIAKLRGQQRDAEDLQLRINGLLKEKKRLDDDKVAVDKGKLLAENAVESNVQAIRQLTERRKISEQTSSRLASEVSSALSSLMPDWLDDTARSKTELTAAANEFAGKKREFELASQSLQARQATCDAIINLRNHILERHPYWDCSLPPVSYACRNIHEEWTRLYADVDAAAKDIQKNSELVSACEASLQEYYATSGTTSEALLLLIQRERELTAARQRIHKVQSDIVSRRDALSFAQKQEAEARTRLELADDAPAPDLQLLQEEKASLAQMRDQLLSEMASVGSRLEEDKRNQENFRKIATRLEFAKKNFARWDRLNTRFGGTRFRTLVQSYILRPLLNNANIYLARITDRYKLTCSEENEQLSILVLDRYNKDQIRSVTVLSGGERFMISLALSLALSSLNRADMNVNILFIDEGFGTLDERSLDSVMSTLERLQEIAGQSGRRVGIISHREELDERIPVQIRVVRHGEGRSHIVLWGTASKSSLD